MINEEVERIFSNHAAWLQKKEGGRMANLSFLDLSGEDLSCLNLSYASFRGCKLRGTYFANATLKSVDFTGADLEKANFLNADLTGAGFARSNLSEANFTNARLDWADFTLSKATDIVLCDTSLVGTRLRAAEFIVAGTDMRGHIFYAFEHPTEGVVIRAGCRRFRYADAVQHWTQAHQDDVPLQTDCITLVLRIAAMAIAKGWSL